MSPVFDAVLLALLLGLAAWLVLTRGSFAATAGFVAYGLLLGIAWLRLGAPDVALTEAAVGGGVTGALLLRAAPRSERVDRLATPPLGLRLAVGAACLLVTLGLALVVLGLPVSAPSLAPAAMAHLSELGLGNPVTAVLMGYRALDTFLEKVVLVVALVAIGSLAPVNGPTTLPPISSVHGPTSFLARLLVPLGILMGVHLLWLGADHPGGAFQAGAVLAAMWLLAIRAELVAAPADRGGLRLVLIVGAAAFLLVGVAGLGTAGALFAYPVAWAKPLILGVEVAMTVSITATLLLMVEGHARPERR